MKGLDSPSLTLEVRERGHEPRGAGVSRHWGGRSCSPQKRPTTPRLSPVRLVLDFSPPGLQDKSSAVLKPGFVVLCSGGKIGSGCARWRWWVHAQTGAGTLGAAWALGPAGALGCSRPPGVPPAPFRIRAGCKGAQVRWARDKQL